MPLAHMEPIWDRFYRYVCDEKLVIETSSGILNSQKGSLSDFAFSFDQLESYITKINNLLFAWTSYRPIIILRLSTVPYWSDMEYD